MSRQMGFYFDQFRCMGCYTCQVACKDFHDVKAGPAKWRRVTSMEWGKYPDPRLAYLSLSCNHCAKPACAEACPVGAIAKRGADGVVVVDRESCLGGDGCERDCRDACPYGAPQFGEGEFAKMEMCDFCLERLEQNRKPICVESCPMRALDADSIEVLKARYGEVREVDGFTCSDKTGPSILFKARYGRKQG